MRIRADAVEAAAAAVVAALQPGVEGDWSVRAGDLEWNVDYTIAHMAGAPAKYALCLSSSSTRNILVRVYPTPGATRQERLEAIHGCSAALAGVATAAPKDACGFHASGMQNAEGFLALACFELLVHAYDVTLGLGLLYGPPEELCRLVADHFYPDQVEQRPALPFLVWMSGRPHPATTGWGPAPNLDEHSEIPLEFARDHATGEWHAIRWAT